MLDVFQLNGSVGTIARQHVEAELCVEDFFGQRFEGEEACGLFLQLSEPGVSAFAGRLENLHYGVADWVKAVHPAEDLRKYGGSGMCDHVDRTFRYRIVL